MCKVCASVLNLGVKRGVDLHDSLHGFREGQGTGTTTPGDKLDQKLAQISHEPLF